MATENEQALVLAWLRCPMGMVQLWWSAEIFVFQSLNKKFRHEFQRKLAFASFGNSNHRRCSAWHGSQSCLAGIWDGHLPFEGPPLLFTMTSGQSLQFPAWQLYHRSLRVHSPSVLYHQPDDWCKLKCEWNCAHCVLNWWKTALNCVS